jgi:hypothetical protein
MHGHARDDGDHASRLPRYTARRPTTRMTGAQTGAEGRCLGVRVDAHVGGAHLTPLKCTRVRTGRLPKDFISSNQNRLLNGQAKGLGGPGI